MMAPGVTLLCTAGDRALWDNAGWEASGFSYLLAGPWEAEGSGRCRVGARISFPPTLVLPRPAVRQQDPFPTAFPGLCLLLRAAPGLDSTCPALIGGGSLGGS